MDHNVRIQIMGNYLIFIHEQRVENPLLRSRKGSALILLLILHRGEPVPNQQLLHSLWSDNIVTNPENALKTLVSRVRTMLNRMYKGLGDCLVSDRGAYHWGQRDDVCVDYLELMDLFDAVEQERDPEQKQAMYARLIKLYQGDLYQTGSLEEEAKCSAQLHRRYLDAVYDYISLLWKQDASEEISAVCRTALEVDSFDDQLHIELMKAMVHQNHVSDAMSEYRHTTNMNYRYRGVEPSVGMQDFYSQLSHARHAIRRDLNVIRDELNRNEGERGALVCEYPVFKEVYSLQMRNLERLGTSMFLGLITIGEGDEGRMGQFRMNNIMMGLTEILRDNLRKGDIITRFAPNTTALLLPTVNYETGAMVLERIRRLFYKRYPNSEIPFYYRLGMLGRNAVVEPDAHEVD